MINLFWSGLLILLLSGCGWDGTPTRHNDFTPLTSIEIVAISSTIAAHTSTKLSVKGNFSGLFTRDITDQAVWSSESPTVARFVTASSPNRVTGLAPGTAILTATVGDITSPSFNFTVSSATISTMTITPVDPSIAKGLNTQLTVNGTFSDLTTQDLTFDATWTSSDPNVATVSNDANNKGFAQALDVGTSTISATFDSGSTTTLLTVTEPILQSITVTPENPSILTLSSTSFTATGHYSDESSVDITNQVAWISSRTDLATIASGGVATTLLQGTTSISATLNDVSGTATLKVTGGNLTGIAISPVDPKLVKDTTLRMTATGTFSNGASRDITGAIVWSIANTDIATVTTPGGNLAWLNAGTSLSTPVVITAESGTISATTNLTVTAPLLQSITISPTSLQELTAKTSARFTLTALFTDGTTQDVTANTDWTSNADNVATIANTGIDKGRVSGVAAGSTTINAEYGGVTVTAPVTVQTRTIQTLNISAASGLVSGNQVKFTATASYFDGTSKDVTEDTAWSIDKSNVAILADSQNQPGQVVAVDTGSATISANFDSKTQTMTITVP